MSSNVRNGGFRYAGHPMDTSVAGPGCPPIVVVDRTRRGKDVFVCLPSELASSEWGGRVLPLLGEDFARGRSKDLLGHMLCRERWAIGRRARAAPRFVIFPVCCGKPAAGSERMR